MSQEAEVTLDRRGRVILRIVILGVAAICVLAVYRAFETDPDAPGSLVNVLCEHSPEPKASELRPAYVERVHDALHDLELRAGDFDPAAARQLRRAAGRLESALDGHDDVAAALPPTIQAIRDAAVVVGYDDPGGCD